MPKEQNPCASGGETWINAQSTGINPRRNNIGTSLRNIGIYSARPALTASRIFAPTKKAFTLNDCSIPGTAYGAGPSVWSWTISTFLNECE